MTSLSLASAILETPASRARLVESFAPMVFRTDLEAPGFVLMDVGAQSSPEQFRAHLIDLGRGLADYYHGSFGQLLRFVSVSRFDQQNPTRPHRDGGPEASILLLGYEPTEVSSHVFLLDYTRAAVDRRQTPAEFLDQNNPAFGGDAALLADYRHELKGLCHTRYQILIINNSCLPYRERHRGMLGVLHQALIAQPLPGKSRFINSLLLGISSAELDELQLEAFTQNGNAATA